MIHLPGLFEEAEKNDRKGNGECCAAALSTCIINNGRQRMKRVELSTCAHSRLAWMCSGLKGWDKRLIISDRAHIGKSSPGAPWRLFVSGYGGGVDCVCVFVRRNVHVRALLSLRCVRVCVPSLPPPQCLTSTKRLMGFRNSRGRSKQARSKNTVALTTAAPHTQTLTAQALISELLKNVCQIKWNLKINPPAVSQSVPIVLLNVLSCCLDPPHCCLTVLIPNPRN